MIAAAKATSWIRRPGGGSGAGAHGGHFALVGAMPADEKLLAQVAALPAADDEPGVDPVVAARPDAQFSLGRIVRPFRATLAVGVALVAVDALAGLAGPALVRAGVAQGVARQSTAGLTAATAAFAAVVLIDWWALWAGARWTGRLSERLLYSLRVKVFAHLSRLGLDFYEREMGGRILTRMTSDIEALSQLFQQGIVNLVASGLTAVGVAVVLFVLDWRLALVAMSVVPPLLVLTVWFRRSSDRAYLRIRDKVALVMARLQESLSGARVVAAFAREDRNLEEFRAVADEHLDARLEGNRLSATYFPTVEFLGQLSTALVVAYGASLIRAGSLTPADLIAFILYLSVFFAPVQQLSQVFDTYQQARAAATKLAELLATPVSTPDAPGAVPPGDLAGALGLEDVGFRYSAAGELRPRRRRPRDRAGRDGGARRPDGRRQVDDRQAAGPVLRPDRRAGDGRRHRPPAPLAACLPPPASVSSRRRRTSSPAPSATTSPTAGPTPPTPRSKRRPGRSAPTSSSPACRTATTRRSWNGAARCPAASASSWPWPGPGSSTRPSSCSTRRRRTSTSRSEARVAAAMGALSRGRTTVIVAHRLATAARADRIVVLAGGRVIEEGSHSALLAGGGVYAAMWAAGDPEAGPGASAALAPEAEIPSLRSQLTATSCCNSGVVSRRSSPSRPRTGCSPRSRTRSRDGEVVLAVGVAAVERPAGEVETVSVGAVVVAVPVAVAAVPVGEEVVVTEGVAEDRSPGK